MKRLDMMGQPCPIPVVQARKTLEAGAEALEVLVDNEIAVQNLQKMATGEGYGFVREKPEGNQFRVTLYAAEEAGGERTAGQAEGEPGTAWELLAEIPAEEAGGMAEPQANASALLAREGLTVLVAREWLGDGAEELGRLLMKGFLFSLTELTPPPRRLIFVNGGAKLTTRGANTVPDLQALAQKGTEVYTCGTCANFYGIKDALAVGQLTDMMCIARMLAEAGKPLSL